MKSRYKILLSLVCAVGFLMISYFATNLNFPISGEKALIGKLEIFHNIFNILSNGRQYKNDSILYIDVSYDKQLIPALDENYIPQGYKPITDRRKLLELLECLKTKDNYKYILLDVFFPYGSETKEDSALFATILSMPRIVIPIHNGEEIADSSLTKKAGYADYIKTLSESDFVKYPYISDNGVSLPLKMYQELTGHSIKKYGPLFFDGGHLARKSMVVKFEEIPMLPIKHDYIQERVYYNLGIHLLGDSIPELGYVGQRDLYDNPNLVNNKYIVIGALKSGDLHKTYIGRIPGAIININAFLALIHGHHLISLTLTIILFVTFFILCYLSFSQKSLVSLLLHALHKKTKTSKSRNLTEKILNVSGSWLSYSVFLSILCVITYCVLGEVYDILITSTAYVLFNWIVSKHLK